MLFKIVFLLSSIAACQSNDSGKNLDSSHLKYFGFTLIDVGWDDPLDNDAKTNYLNEVSSFSNVADILVIKPTDPIIDRLNLMENHATKAILHLSEIFFEQIDNQSPSGVNYNLRDNYKLRWDTFVKTNTLNAHKNKIKAFYIGEEPTWNGISFKELQSATDYVKETFPGIPIMIIEAYPILDEMKVPTSVDWVGFDHYFIKDPKNNTQFLSELSVVKSKLVTEDQKLVLIMDSHFIKETHEEIHGISQNDMELVANSYYELANNEPKVIAILGYTWPGGFDSPTTLGARQLPESVKETYMRIGKEITQKN